MASIRIHQDLYNFERKRKGFTPRQWGSVVCAAAAAIAVTALCAYGLRLPPEACILPAAVAMAPFVVNGFVPIQRMPADRFVERSAELGERADGVVWHGEAAPERESELSREYIRKSRKRFYECGGSAFVEGARARIEAGNTGPDGSPLEWAPPCRIMP